MEKLEITKDYGTHQYKEAWEKTDYFCPNCGEQEVWCEHGPGDYYQGVNHACMHCHFAGTLLPWIEAKGVDLQVINQITAALNPKGS